MTECNRKSVLPSVLLLCITASAVNSLSFSSDSSRVTKTDENAWTATDKVFSSWFNYNNNWLCDLVPNDILNCPTNESIRVLSSHCVTYNEQKGLLEVGKCIYNFSGTFKSTGVVYTPIASDPKEMDKFTCGTYNRTGTLCGKCKNGTYPLVYTYDMDCADCPNGRANWWKFALIAFLPLTVFYFIILLFKIKIASSYLQGFVFHSQTISMPGMVRLLLITTRHMPLMQSTLRVLLAFYGIWNLDFFRTIDFGICLGIGTLESIVLDLAVGIYPLLLMVLTYFLIDLHDRNFGPLVVIWKPFGAIFKPFQQSWDVKTSLIDAFNTFIILSNVKFMGIASDLLAHVHVYQVNSSGNMTISSRPYNNAEVEYFGAKHLPFAILGIAIIVIFIFLPTVIPILYSLRCFHKFLNLLPVRWYILHTFMDSLVSCYKDGTQPGTRDYRWFASVFYILRIATLLIGMATFNAMFFPLASMVIAFAVIVFINAEPFKESHCTTNIVGFLLLLALSYTVIISYNYATYKVMVLVTCILGLIAVLPLLYISAIILSWMYGHRKFGLKLLGRLYAWTHGYELLQ